MDRVLESSIVRRTERAPRRRALATAAAAGLTTAIAGRSASAATLYWDPGATGIGTWTTATGTVDWASTNVTQAADSFWTNGSTAFFSNPSVTSSSLYNVSLGTSIVSAGIEFNRSSAVNISAGSFSINNGTGSVVLDAGAGAVTIASNISIGSSTTTNATGTFTNNSANTLTLGTLTTNGLVSGVSFNGTGSITVNGAIGGGTSATEFGITDNDTGTLSLNAATSNYGQSHLNAGTVSLNIVGGLGTSTINLGATSGSAAVKLRMPSGTTANGVTVGTTTGTIQIDTLGASSPVLSGAISGANATNSNLNLIQTTTGSLTISGTVNGLGTLTLGAGGTATGSITVSGAISNLSSGLVVNGSPGQTLTLSGVNTYATPTTVNSGALTLNHGSTADLATNTVSGAIVVNAGAKLVLSKDELGYATSNASSSSTHLIALTGATMNTGSGAGIHNYLGTLNLSGGSTVNVGTGGLTGGNAGPAGTQVFDLQAINSMGSGATTNNLSGGATGGIDPRGTLTFAVARGSAASDLTVSAVIQDDPVAPAGIAMTGTGILTLAGANTYSQGTQVSGGTVLVGANATATAGPLGNASGGVTLFSDGGAALLTNGAFTVQNPVLFALDPTTGVNALGGNTNNSSTFAGPITLAGDATFTQVATTAGHALGLTGGITTGNADAYTATFAGPGAIIVSGGSVADGAGTLSVSVTGGKVTITAPGTFSGGTTISGGTLRAENAAGTLGSGPVAINGGVLAGSGTTGTGTVSVSGGTITAGTGATAADTIGTLTTGPVDLAGGTYAVKVDLAAATTAAPATGTSVNATSGLAASDQLLVSGLLTASASGVALSVAPVPVSAAASGQTYSFVIADASSGGSGNAGVFDALLQSGQVALSSTTDAAGDTYGLSTADGGEQLLLDVTAAAPEPTSLLLAALAAAPLVLGRRRSRRTA